MFSFEKGTAMITGGGSGIGRATSLMLARMGVPVGVADIDRATIEQTVTNITDVGGEALTVQIDVQDKSSVDTAFARSKPSVVSLYPHKPYSAVSGSFGAILYP